MCTSLSFISRNCPDQLAREKDIFYWKAKDKVPDDPDSPWFAANSPVGHNVLDGKLKKNLRSGGVKDENRSYHSLRATAIS